VRVQANLVRTQVVLDAVTEGNAKYPLRVSPVSSYVNDLYTSVAEGNFVCPATFQDITAALPFYDAEYPTPTKPAPK
jgi:hypothetical protein